VEGPLSEAGDLSVWVDGRLQVLRYHQGMVLDGKQTPDLTSVGDLTVLVQRNTAEYRTAIAAGVDIRAQSGVMGHENRQAVIDAADKAGNVTGDDILVLGPVIRVLVTKGGRFGGYIKWVPLKRCWSYFHKARRAFTKVTRGKEHSILSYVKQGRPTDTECGVLIKPGEFLTLTVGTSTIRVKGPISACGDLLVKVDKQFQVLRCDQVMVLGHCKKTLDLQIVPKFTLLVQKNTRLALT
jgi:hypothetical protein